jgi:hypothetical protein
LKNSCDLLFRKPEGRNKAPFGKNMHACPHCPPRLYQNYIYQGLALTLNLANMRQQLASMLQFLAQFLIFFDEVALFSFEAL